MCVVKLSRSSGAICSRSKLTEAPSTLSSTLHRRIFEPEEAAGRQIDFPGADARRLRRHVEAIDQLTLLRSLPLQQSCRLHFVRDVGRRADEPDGGAVLVSHDVSERRHVARDAVARHPEAVGVGLTAVRVRLFSLRHQTLEVLRLDQRGHGRSILCERRLFEPERSHAIADPEKLARHRIHFPDVQSCRLRRHCDAVGERLHLRGLIVEFAPERLRSSSVWRSS